MSWFKLLLRKVTGGDGPSRSGAETMTPFAAMSKGVDLVYLPQSEARHWHQMDEWSLVMVVLSLPVPVGSVGGACGVWVGGWCVQAAFPLYCMYNRQAVPLTRLPTTPRQIRPATLYSRARMGVSQGRQTHHNHLASRTNHLVQTGSPGRLAACPCVSPIK
jgi:hypothetical protein